MARGRNKQQIEAIARFFGDLPVVDATENLRVFPNEQDIITARRKDPEHCVYANSCRRLYGSTAVLFFRSVAYVDLPDTNGDRVVNRFVLDETVRRLIATYDSTGKMAPGGFLLSAPSASKTLEGKRKRSELHLKRKRGDEPPPSPHRRAAALMGTATRKRAVLSGMATDIRNGTGMVHFVERRDK